MQRCRKLLFLAFGNNFVVFPPFNHSCCELMMKHHMNDHLCASVLLLLQWSLFSWQSQMALRHSRPSTSLQNPTQTPANCSTTHSTPLRYFLKSNNSKLSQFAEQISMKFQFQLLCPWFFSFLSILMFLFLSTSHSAFWNFNGICACALQLAPKLWSKAKLIQIPTKGNLRRLCHNVHNQPVVVRGRHEVGSLPCPRRCHRPPGPRDVQGPEQAVNFCKKLVEEIYF